MYHQHVAAICFAFQLLPHYRRMGSYPPEKSANGRVLMVIPARFERATYRLGICRSILLSYGITDRLP